MGINIVASYIYMGSVLGILGSGLYVIFHQGDKLVNTISILAGGITGTLATIGMLETELYKSHLISLILLGYMGASITR